MYRDGEVILEVECGGNKGLLYLSRLCQGSKGPCILFRDTWLTPNEFQYVSGRETAKDWKRSIRHHGKSMKLLLAKGVLSVHPPVCDCSGCRIGSPLQQSLGSTVGGLRSDRLISGGEAAKRAGAGGQSPSDGHSLAAASAGGADDHAELQGGASTQLQSSSAAAAAAAVSAAVSAAAATAASSPASLLASLNAGAALLAARQSQQQHHQSPNLLLGSAFNAMEAARKHSLADSASPEPKRESRLTSIIDQLLINKTKDYLQQCSDLTKSTNHHNNSNDTSQSPALDPGTHSSQPSSPLSRNSAGTGAENTDRLDSDVSDRLSSSIASGSEEEPLDKPAAASSGATSNGGVVGVGPAAGVTTASRRKRSSAAASQLLPVNGTALLTHPASDIKVERLSPESDTASPQSSPSPARVFPPGLGFVLGLRPGLVPGHPFPPGVIAAAAAQAAVDRQTLAAPALKQVEMMTRNYSDFMRSLAAKYNNPTGQDGFGFSPSNGAVPPGLLRGFEPPFPFKAAGTPPLQTSGRQSAGRDGGGGGGGVNNNAASHAANAAGGGNVDSDSAGHATPNHGLPPHHGGGPVASAAQPRATPPLKPSSATSSPPSALLEPHRGSAPFNLSDFSSSQTLLNLVRTASAQSASQLETYLRGAVKRPHDGEPARADPLDLSLGGTAVKRPRSTDSPRSSSGSKEPADDARTPPRKQATSPWLLQLEGARGASKSPKLRCGSVCSDQASSLHSPCSGAVGTTTTTEGGQQQQQQLVAKWTVDDVVQFVASVESCQEYAEKFREQSIDGTSLPLLTEDHLTVYMGMRLGPALKLRTTLAKLTGRCTVCMHCIHCHGEENDRRSTFSASPASSSTPTAPAASAAASSAGSAAAPPPAPGTPIGASTPPAPPSATPPRASPAPAHSPASSK
ncbi:sterile alpha motif domain-containing protein 11-like isoform X1 [Dermacentor albipictus]|uniref:sterile alpha motif domain-containing protein 11-like isoform X1 n=2 Tax=Dermacentor albipictus TaxID=60249 RepID=UPI0038FC529A